MSKFLAVVFAALMVVAGSGCALISRQTVPIEGGKKTTVGILSIDAIGDGYPMIPCYTTYDMDK